MPRVRRSVKGREKASIRRQTAPAWLIILNHLDLSIAGAPLIFRCIMRLIPALLACALIFTAPASAETRVFIVANHADEAFGKSTNRATLVFADSKEPLEPMSKADLADQILDRVRALCAAEGACTGIDPRADLAVLLENDPVHR